MLVVLVDCDNFFASCERIMQPHLRGVPVAVLSNNDGCVIARTNEVKRAGVTMGQPYHECEKVLKNIGAEVVSANFLLYRSCAKRLQTVLKQLPTQRVEVYSIDESFMYIDDANIEDIETWMISLRALILQWTGVEVTIGVARSQALAKVAVQVGKKTESHCVNLVAASDNVNHILGSIQIEDVWGVGRRLAPKLKVCGVRSAYDLANIKPNNPALKLLNKTGRVLIEELCGWQPSIAILDGSPRKSMAHTRSFGAAITSYDDLRSAVASFADELGAKLRRHKLVAAHISVFVRYREPGTIGVEQRLVEAQSERSVAPTADTFALESVVQEILEKMYKGGLRYKKAGVILSSLRPAERYQLSLYDTADKQDKSESLMHAIDIISNELQASAQPAVSLLGQQAWRGKRQHVSPFDHSSWQTIPIVKA